MVYGATTPSGIYLVRRVEYKMATPVIMPRQGQSVESCIIAKWNKKINDKVELGDLLFSYETDKASFEETSKLAGTMLEIFFDEGDDVPVLTNVCVIGNPGESTEEFKPQGDDSGNAPERAETEIKVEPEVTTTKAEAGDVTKISPRAKKLAERTNADLGLAQATGPDGRIIERDVERLISEGKMTTYAAAGAAVSDVTGTGIGGRVTTDDLASKPAIAEGAEISEVTEVKLSNIRKVIAKAMHGSLSEMAQLTLNTSFDASSILNYRKLLKQKGESVGMEKVTLNDMILFAVSRVLLKHKEINANLVDDTMLLFKDVHLGVATDTPRGLMVPNVFNANRMSLLELSKESKRITGLCRDGACSPDLLSGGSFTVTNLGSLGVESFTPVINPPQTAILGVCNITNRIREVDGKLSSYPAMGLSVTFDHRAVDGAPVARFMQDLCKALEDFPMFLGV